MSNPPEISDLTTHLGYWMRMVSNAVSHAVARRVEAEDVTVAEWVFMRELYDVEQTPPSRLAERMGMTRGAITKLADRLISKQLVIRVANPDDRRAQTLALTAEGRRRVPLLAGLADANDAAFFGALAPDERAALEAILKKIVERQGLKSVPVE